MGGGNYWWKKLFRATFCVPAPLAPTSVLTQNKGPDTEPHFSNPPPPSAGVHVTPPPPPRRAIFRSPSTMQTVGVHLVYLPEQFSGPAAQTAAQLRTRHYLQTQHTVRTHSFIAECHHRPRSVAFPMKNFSNGNPLESIGKKIFIGEIFHWKCSAGALRFRWWGGGGGTQPHGA